MSQWRRRTTWSVSLPRPRQKKNDGAPRKPLRLRKPLLRKKSAVEPKPQRRKYGGLLLKLRLRKKSVAGPKPRRRKNGALLPKLLPRRKNGALLPKLLPRRKNDAVRRKPLPRKKNVVGPKPQPRKNDGLPL